MEPKLSMQLQISENTLTIFFARKQSVTDLTDFGIVTSSLQIILAKKTFVISL